MKKRKELINRIDEIACFVSMIIITLWGKPWIILPIAAVICELIQIILNGKNILQILKMLIWVISIIVYVVLEMLFPEFERGYVVFVIALCSYYKISLDSKFKAE